MPRTKLDKFTDPYNARAVRDKANTIIRGYMVKNGVKQNQLCRMIGMAPATMSVRINDGKARCWELPELVAICKVLKISEEDKAKMLGG